MSLKRKMSMGIMAGALGISLIGGGTWAAFNDVERVSNTFAAGTLDLGTDYSGTHLFKLSNLKPGDHFTRTLTLSNDGSLDINQIFLTTNVSGWVDHHGDATMDRGYGVENTNMAKLPDKGKNTENDFLSQFDVEIKHNNEVKYTGTLLGLKQAGDTTIDITKSGADAVGLGTGLDKDYEIKITFRNDNTVYPGTRLQQQNKYQGEGADIELVFEATQMKGQNRSQNSN